MIRNYLHLKLLLLTLTVAACTAGSQEKTPPGAAAA